MDFNWGLSYHPGISSNLFLYKQKYSLQLVSVSEDEFNCPKYPRNLLKHLFQKAFHFSWSSLGDPHAISPVIKEKLKKIVHEFNPVTLSETLSFNSLNGIPFGEAIPFPLTPESFAIVKNKVSILQDLTNRNILLENIVRYFSYDDALPEPLFLNKLCRVTGCRVSLNIGNLLVNDKNGIFDFDQYIASLETNFIEQIILPALEEVNLDVMLNLLKTISPRFVIFSTINPNFSQWQKVFENISNYHPSFSTYDVIKC